MMLIRHVEEEEPLFIRENGLRENEKLLKENLLIQETHESGK